MSKTEIHRRQALALLGALMAGCGRGGVDPSKDNVDDPLERELSSTGAVPDVVRVGITPTLGSGTSGKLAPLYEYLAERLGRRVEGHTAKSYDDLAVLVRDQKVELAVFSPAAYVTARKGMEAVAIATATRNGSPTYLGYLFVKNTGDKRPLLTELEGKTVAWVSEYSTSGYLYPRVMLKDKGIDPDAFFSKHVFAKSHDEAIRMVAEGEVDVGAAASPFVDPETHQTRDGATSLTVVAKTDRIPLD
ncbi:MAG TPA: phosphate/phosphite/phosphonate ABC transporter substrate-binding protein, partial [Polyangiaceae bacterium]|nr:phosphate/phosphite/phosphonate ABC transporter substrate-binding protein [Polyangiaceae bacterium]